MDGPPGGSEAALVDRLRAGDSESFRWLVDAHSRWLRHLARQYVNTDAVAAEVVQDTWLAVIEGVDRFEGRSSLRTWIGRILMNQARSRGVREARSVPFASVASDDPGGFDAERFLGSFNVRAGSWAAPPTDWSTLPVERLEAKEAKELVHDAIEGLPDQQRNVITLRDIQGWSADEVCEMLDISDGNQRVLLHRARSLVRRALDTAFREPA